MSESKPTYYAEDGWVRKQTPKMDLLACQAYGVDAEMLAHLMNQGELVPELVTALETFVAGYMSNPGTSDLDDEQPIIMRIYLGDWRKARAALAKAHEETKS